MSSVRLMVAFSQRSSATALPACWAFASYFVVGPADRDGQVGRVRGRPGAAGARRRRPRRSARRSRRGRSRRAGPRRAAAGRRSGRRSPAAAAGACGGAPSATGRGRTRARRSAMPGASMCSSTSTPSPRISRMLVDAFAVDGAEQLGEPAPVHLDGDDVEVRLGLGHRQRRDAGTAADLQHQRAPTGRTRRRCRAGPAAPSASRACMPSSGQRRSHVCLLAAGERRPPGPEAGDAGVGRAGRGIAGRSEDGVRPPRAAHASVHGRSSRPVYPHRGAD